MKQWLCVSFMFKCPLWWHHGRAGAVSLTETWAVCERPERGGGPGPRLGPPTHCWLAVLALVTVGGWWDEEMLVVSVSIQLTPDQHHGHTPPGPGPGKTLQIQTEEQQEDRLRWQRQCRAEEERTQASAEKCWDVEVPQEGGQRPGEAEAGRDQHQLRPAAGEDSPPGSFQWEVWEVEENWHLESVHHVHQVSPWQWSSCLLTNPTVTEPWRTSWRPGSPGWWGSPTRPTRWDGTRAVARQGAACPPPGVGSVGRGTTVIVTVRTARARRPATPTPSRRTGGTELEALLTGCWQSLFQISPAQDHSHLQGWLPCTQRSETSENQSDPARVWPAAPHESQLQAGDVLQSEAAARIRPEPGPCHQHRQGDEEGPLVWLSHPHPRLPCRHLLGHVHQWAWRLSLWS